MGKFIPTEHYIGYHKAEEGGTPLAFITPNGTDKAALNRIDTVQRWSSGHQGAGKDLCKVIDNPAMSGFRIADDIVKRWSTQNVLWRIFDPRGFQLEISSGNMAYILGNGEVKNGEIIGEMRWCRNGSTNYLLPVTSPEYLTYQENSMAKRVSTKDLVKGDIILLGGSDQVTYLGRYTLVAARMNRFGREEKILNQKRFICFKEKDGSFIAKPSLPKYTKLVEKVTVADETDYSDEMIAKGVDPSWYYFGADDIKWVQRDPIKLANIIPSLQLEDMSEHFENKKFETDQSYIQMLEGSPVIVLKYCGRKSYYKIFGTCIEANQYGRSEEIHPDDGETVRQARTRGWGMNHLKTFDRERLSKEKYMVTFVPKEGMKVAFA